MKTFTSAQLVAGGRRGVVVVSFFAFLGLSGCTATRGGAGRVNPSQSVAGSRTTESAGAVTKEGREFRSVEEEEEADEARLREGWLKALAGYRAPSCGVAIGKVEALLKRGRGRWQERTENGALPGDLAALLSEAELWASQSEPVCADSAMRPRFDALRLLMDTIWQYPTRASKTEFEQRLTVLGD